jgi:hypothetical protein
MAKQGQNGKFIAAKVESEVNTVFEQLDLTAEEIAVLRQQGFITREVRGAGTVVFKLRFRLHGRQRVKYLGTDADRCDAIAVQLERLQRARRIDAKLRKLNRAAAKLLRESKRRLEPLVAQCGRHFHGRAIRRWRGTAIEIRNRSV